MQDQGANYFSIIFHYSGMAKALNLVYRYCSGIIQVIMAVAFSLINIAQNHIQEGANYAELKSIITATGQSRAYAYRLKGPCITLDNS